MESCLFVREDYNIKAAKPQEYLFNGQPLANGAGGDFDNRYSQRGVKWAVKQVAKAVGILKKFMYIHYVTRMQLICSKMVWILSRSKTFNTSKYRDDDGLLQIAKL
jgi:hypothetical protein